MPSNFPTSLDSLTNPTSANTLAEVPHADQHANANDAIEALEAKVGVNSSAVTTSLDYRIAQLEARSNPSFTDKAVPSGSVNGTNTRFTVSQTPTSGSEHVFRNGVLQKGGGVDYTLSGTTITFVTAPESGDLLLASYRY